MSSFAQFAVALMMVFVVVVFGLAVNKSVSDRIKLEAVVEEQVVIERTERQKYLDGLGNPHLEPDYYKGLAPVDISANYNLVCIHGMPYFKSILTGGELLAIPPYSWKINHWAWRACRELY